MFLSKLFRVGVHLRGLAEPFDRRYAQVPADVLVKMERTFIDFQARLNQSDPPVDPDQPVRVPVLTFVTDAQETHKGDVKHHTPKLFASAQLVWYDVLPAGAEVLRNTLNDLLTPFEPYRV